MMPAICAKWRDYITAGAGRRFQRTLLGRQGK
jgi:hypothetical protein